MLLALSGGQTNPSRALPRFISGAIPAYPPVAWTAHVTGTVLLEITVAHGSVVTVHLIGSPSLSLAAPSVKNVRTWKFDPRASGIIHVSYTYRIKGAVTEVPASPRVDLDLPARVVVTVRPFRPTVSY